MSRKVPNLESLSDVKTFYSCIDNADPNSPNISVDNTNSSWGHYQFTAGSLTIDLALLSWTAVGSVDMVYCLIAASIKTHRIAVQICTQCSLHPTLYLSDIYLARVVEKLLGLAKTVEVPENLHNNELKTWITDNSIPVLSGHIGMLKKQGLIDAITMSGKIPANDDFKKLISLGCHGKKAIYSSGL
ncbi:hypothetical protein H1R20_g13008, partial [Candolleomyces eurysporus]